LTKDLLNLYGNDFIESATGLNNTLVMDFFSVKKLPMCFTGKVHEPTTPKIISYGKEMDNSRP
jgi:hypothetical protein